MPLLSNNIFFSIWNRRRNLFTFSFFLLSCHLSPFLIALWQPLHSPPPPKSNSFLMAKERAQRKKAKLRATLLSLLLLTMSFKGFFPLLRLIDVSLALFLFPSLSCFSALEKPRFTFPPRPCFPDFFVPCFPLSLPLQTEYAAGKEAERGGRRRNMRIYAFRGRFFFSLLPSFLLIDIRLAAAAPEKRRGFRKYRIHFSPSLFGGCFISPPFPRTLNRIYPPRP